MLNKITTINVSNMSFMAHLEGQLFPNGKVMGIFYFNQFHVCLCKKKTNDT